MAIGMRAKILELLDDADVYEASFKRDVSLSHLADRLLELFNQQDHNRCDFDCDNCHDGGCGNPDCERMGCPEENAAHADFTAMWDAAVKEGHTISRCPICKTVLCRLFT